MTQRLIKFLLTINFMTMDFDYLTLSYLRNFTMWHQQNLWKSMQKCQASNSFDIENKFLYPIWIWGQNNTKYESNISLDG